MIIVVAILAIMIIGVMLIPTEVAKAEANNELIINETTDDAGNVTTTVGNIGNYVNSAKKSRSTVHINNQLNELLLALKYSQKSIDTMSQAEKNEFLTAQDATVSYSSAVIEQNPTEDVTTNKNYMYKMHIWSRAIRSGMITTKDGIRDIYRIIGTVEYDKFTGNGHIPQYRLKDLMAFAWTGDNIVQNEGRSATLVCDVFNSRFVYKRTDTNYLGGKFVKEYSAPPGFAIQFNLPNNSLSNIYNNFIMTTEFRLAALNDFDLYLEYGHKTVGGSASVSIKGDASIDFNKDVDEAKAPVLGIKTPIH